LAGVLELVRGCGEVVDRHEVAARAVEPRVLHPIRAQDRTLRVAHEALDEAVEEHDGRRAVVAVPVAPGAAPVPLAQGPAHDDQLVVLHLPQRVPQVRKEYPRAVVDERDVAWDLPQAREVEWRAPADVRGERHVLPLRSPNAALSPGLEVLRPPPDRRLVVPVDEEPAAWIRHVGVRPPPLEPAPVVAPVAWH